MVETEDEKNLFLKQIIQSQIPKCTILKWEELFCCI